MEKTSIRNTILLGSLSIGTWTGRKVAKEQARKIEQDARAKTGTVSATKHLFAGVPELEAITKKATVIRVAWGERTVPWYDNGPRAFNSAAYMDTMAWIKGEREEFRNLVNVFLPKYPALRESRQFDLQDLFDEKEFPQPSEMRDKFYFNFSVEPVPNAADLRILDGFDQVDVDKMVANAEKRATARAQAGVAHAAQQLFKVVQHMHNRLTVYSKTKAEDPEAKSGKFRDSLVENIAAIVPIMPVLNITNDPELAKLCAEAQKLALYSPDELRANDTTRAKAAKESKALAKKLSDLFNDDKE